MRHPDPEHVLDLVVSCKKPACEIHSPTSLVIRMATMLNLERHYYRSENTPYAIFALPETRALPLIENAPKLFEDTPLALHIDKVVLEIKDMTAAAALRHLNEQPITSPDVASHQILLGMLYGYPACCVRYFVEKDHKHTKHHAFEAHEDFHFYLRCEACAMANVWAPWCDVRQ